MKKIFLVLIFILASCSGQNFQSRSVENYYQSAGVEKYFLSDIPSWANFSEKAGCFRNYSIRFFDLDQLMKNFSLDYSKAIQIQGTFNDDYNRLYTQYKGRAIPLSDEQLLFFKASEKVNGKIQFFEAPTFKRIHLIWIDSMLKSKDEEKRIRDFLKSPTNDEGVPVLVSMCLSKKEIEEKFPDFNHKIISSELMSIYNADGKRTPSLHFLFDNFFTSNQVIYFYSREKIQNNNEFIGALKFVNF